jgi:hypothetical protein
MTLVVGQPVLTWAMDKHTGGKTCVNVIALTELALEFWRFFTLEVLSRTGESPPAILSRAGILPSQTAGAFLLYLPKVLRRDSWPYDDWDLASTTSPIELPWSTVNESDAGALAFHTLREIYERFGLDESLILAGVDGKVSEDEIRKIG